MSNDNNDDSFKEHTFSPELTALGDLISRKRREKNLSVEELARMVEISVADVEALEAGTWDVDVVLLLEISRVLRHKFSNDLDFPPFD